jgi:bla regulator protein BlaR1
MGVRKRIELVSTATVVEPGIFGIFRPLLLLPVGIADHLATAHLDAILAHELCHVRRRDNLAAAMHMVVQALFWFHPLVWWIGNRLVEERERACDEEVLILGSEPEVYAESILKICQVCLESLLACMSGIAGSDLKTRIVRIMTGGAAKNLSPGRRLLLAAAGIIAVSGPIVLGILNAPQSRAQTTRSNRCVYSQV